MKKRNELPNGYPQESKGDMAVFSPKSYDDVENAIDMMKDGKNIIVYLNKLKPEDAQRVMDLLSGAAFALDGSVYEIEKDIFMISPSDINLISDN